MKKILFVSYGGGHVNALLPIYRKLIVDKQYNCSYLALTTAYRRVKETGLPCIGFKDLTDTQSSVLDLGKMLVDKEQQSASITHEESIAYMGLSYRDLVDNLGEQEAKKIYEKHGRQAFYPLHTIKKYLSKEMPDLIIATSAPRAERAAIDAASILGIPAICIVDLFAFNEILWVGSHGFANKICVISDDVKNRIIAAGRSSDEVIVTGNPAFDELLEGQDSHQREKIRNSKGWRKNEKIVLFASSVEPEEHPYSNRKGDVLLPIKVEKELNDIAAKKPNIKVVIRPHPNDFRPPLISSERVEISNEEDNINDLLNAVDCVVVFSSTVGVQAAILKKTVISIDLSISSDYVPYSKMGVSTGINDLNQLGGVIMENLNKSVCNSPIKAKSSATENVIKVIEDVIRSKDINLS